MLETCLVAEQKKNCSQTSWHLSRNGDLKLLGCVFTTFLLPISFDAIFLGSDFFSALRAGCVELKVPLLVSIFTKSLAMLLFLYVPWRTAKNLVQMMMWQ